MNDKFNTIIASPELVLIDFFATWCQPCQVMSSVLRAVKELPVGQNTRMVKIDIDQYPQIAAHFGVRSVPTLLFFRNGELLHRQAGLMSKADLSAHLAYLKQGDPQL
jgi:thioredoxin 1